MTHSLHRTGNVEDLKEDYIILAMLAKGVNYNHPNSREKLLKIAEIMNQHSPTNIMPKFAWKVSPVITASYKDIADIQEVIKILKREDFGVSIIISGLISEVQNMLKGVDLTMHTVHLSLGTFGKKELLPSNEEVLEITTMCGHHCTSPQSVEHYVEQIKAGKITIEKAVEKLAKPCVCGILNKARATKLLSELIEK